MQLSLFEPKEPRRLSVATKPLRGGGSDKLGNIAPRQAITLVVQYLDDRQERRQVITQGWRYRCQATGAELVVCPESDYVNTTWMIVHQPSGYPVIAARHAHMLGWDFDSGFNLCRSPEGLRAIALLLSKLGVPRGFNPRKWEALRDLFKQAGIGAEDNE